MRFPFSNSESSMLYLQQDAHDKKKVIDISWNPIGNILASCGHDKTVKVSHFIEYFEFLTDE